MRSNRYRAALAFTTVAASVLWTSHVISAGRPYTVEDLLQLQDIGRAEFARAGRTLVFEAQDSYEKAPEFGRPWLQGRDRSKLYAVDTSRGGEVAPLFAQEPQAGYWLGSVSPDGSRVAFFRFREGKVSAGVVAIETGRVLEFEFTPDLVPTGTSPVWVSDTELVYAALPEGEQPFVVDAERDAAMRLPALWARAWRGKEPTASAISSPLLPSDQSVHQQRGRLLRVDSRTGRTTALAAGQFSELSIARAQRHLAALRLGDVVQPSATERWAVTGVDREQDLLIVDLDRAGIPRSICTGCRIPPGSLHWSSDRDELLFLSKTEESSWGDLRLRRYRVAADTTHTVAEQDFTLSGPTNRIWRGTFAAWLGKGILILARPRQSEAIAPAATAKSDQQTHVQPAWYLLLDNRPPLRVSASRNGAPPQLLVVSARAALVLEDGEVWRITDNGSRRNLTADVADAVNAARLRSALIVFEPSRPPWSEPCTIVSTVSERAKLISLCSDGTRRLEVDAPTGARALEANARRQIFALRRETQDGPGELLIQQPGSVPLPVFRYNEHLAEVETGRPVRIDYQLPDGRALIAWLLLPAHHDACKPPRTVVNVYPGRVEGAEFRPTLTMLSPQVLAGHGYAVLYPSLPMDRGEVPRDSFSNLAAQLSPLLDKAAAAGHIDPDRLALLGHSAGALSVLSIIGETPRFKGAIAAAGLSELASAYGEFDPRMGVSVNPERLHVDQLLWLPTWAESGQGGLGSPPWQDPERYRRNSPLYRAHRIETPLLLIHGDLDLGPMSQSEQMFTALYRQRKPVTFVRYWGEGHELTSPANVRDMWARIFAWLERFLPEAKQPSCQGNA